LLLLLFVECHLLGRFLEIVKKDNAKAAAVYKSNCEDDQNGNSCFHLAQLYHTELVDHHEAYDFNVKGCDLGNAKCCLGAAMANFSDDLDKGCVGKDRSLAIDNLKRSCQLGSGIACQFLAFFSMAGIPSFVEKDLSAALKLHFEANRQLNSTEVRTTLDAIVNIMKATPTPSSGVQ
jgi:cytochrome c oxidase assembly factor 7